MNRAAAAALAAFLLAAGLGTATADEHNEGVCAALDSGKVDVEHQATTVTVNAPDGFLVASYCVKAGSARQGHGPVYVDVEPTASVTFSHPSGKDVSHWSASFTPVPVVEPEPDPPAVVLEPPAQGPTEHLAPPVPPVVHLEPAPQGVGSPAWREANPGAVVEFG